MQMHRLSPEEAARTDLYLEKLAEGCPGLSVAVQALFGRCCLKTFSDSGAAMEDLSIAASVIGQSILSHREPDKLSLDPLLLIEIHCVLKEAGWTARPLENLLDRI